MANKETPGVRYRHVDNPRVYEFLEEVHALPRNNPISPFDTSSDIIAILREQWAGLFQRLLQEQTRLAETRLIQDLESTARTLNQLVTFLTEERRNRDDAIKEILVSNHPAFYELKRIMRTQYRVFFTNREEMEAWLTDRGYRLTDSSLWEDADYQEWVATSKAKRSLLKIGAHIFDEDGRLKVFTRDEWKSSWIRHEEMMGKPQPAGPPPAPFDNDDDLPF